MVKSNKCIQLLVYFFVFCFFQLNGQNIESQLSENEAKANAYLTEGKSSAAAQLYNQSAYLLRSVGRLAEAAEYYQKVLDINTQLGNKRGQISAHNSLSLLYLESENYAKAIYHLKQEFEFQKQSNNKTEMINILTNLALAESETSGFNNAVLSIEQAIGYAKELNDLNKLKQCYGIAYDIYEMHGEQTKSRSYFELYSAIDRRLKELKMSEITSEADRKVTVAESEKLQTQKQLNLTSEELEKTATNLQKVEKLTREQKMELELREAKINEQKALLETEKLKRRYLTFGITALSIFVLILSVLLYEILKAKKKINQQRLWLEKQNKEIRASIRYAQTIQQAMLPATKEIERYFDSFILYKPKDIVSGDFYWIAAKEENGKEIVFFALVDCTGHGVPGAFMSMIGNRLLNEIVNERKIESPALVLELLNKMIREALRQEETDNNDGMDLALCKFDIQKGLSCKLTFAGAKRPVYIIKNNENRLIVHNGDRKSIGGYNLSKREIHFVNYEEQLDPGDMIYLFSDGIIDQNGLERKKFGRGRLEETMIDCVKLRSIEQHAIFKQRLEDFMNKEDQRDDITLIGLKMI